MNMTFKALNPPIAVTEIVVEDNPADEIYHQGWLAYSHGKTIDANPYNFNTAMWRMWNDGWHTNKDQQL